MTTNQNIATSVITSSMCLLGYQVVVFLIEVFQLLRGLGLEGSLSCQALEDDGANTP